MDVQIGGVVGGIGGAMVMTGIFGPHALSTDTGLLVASSIVTAISAAGTAVLVALIQAKSARDLAELKFRADRESRDEDEDEGTKEEAP